MVTSKRSVRVAAVAAAVVLGGGIVAACGGDDGGGGSALSDEAFCARVAEIEAETASLSQEEADEQFLETFTALAAQAPNSELRSALTTLADVFEQLDAIDDDDPEAFGEIFTILGDQDFITAVSTVETYFVETCGFDPDEFGVLAD